ncbi:MAG: PQQ-binding-like beta-propeller repeat protein [Planctomycetota bacterium]|jgi:outer membrane protein assembly factor BamB|nr:PQQ-binding-like beta-propeller repeat protein [Planctomycetota bacterium]MDP7251165.1 PQQ-binding-like beta-propeller repeat protein [Planctomycetota bacterium]
MNKKLSFPIGLLAVFILEISAGDWPQYRGPAGNGHSTETGLPTEWGPGKNIKWRAPLPGPGNSSPVVIGERVFVTVATDSGKQRHLYCFDRKDGKLHWIKTVEFEANEPTHRTNPYGGSSPAADAERVVVWHSSAGLYCYDHGGKELWKRDLGKFVHIWGYGASPVIYKDRILLNCGPGEQTSVIALDKKTGKTIWQKDEPGGASGLKKRNPSDKRAPWLGSWSTPQIVTDGGKELVFVAMPHHIQAYEPGTGEILWKCSGLGDLVYCDPVFGTGRGVAMSGYTGPAIGFKLEGDGDVTESHRLWRSTSKNPQRIGSGVIIGKRLFMANEPGIAQCIDLETGKDIWKARLPGGRIWGSVLHAEGRLYVTNQKGSTIIFAPNPEKLEILKVNHLNEPSNSTPAFSNGEIFLRTFKAVYCVGE